jgi:hypothetical protein
MSDVWYADPLIYHLYVQLTVCRSFGVLMFELSTCGSVPYENMAVPAIMQLLQQGKRLQLPLTAAPVFLK